MEGKKIATEPKSTLSSVNISFFLILKCVHYYLWMTYDMMLMPIELKLKPAETNLLLCVLIIFWTPVLPVVQYVSDF